MITMQASEIAIRAIFQLDSLKDGDLPEGINRREMELMAAKCLNAGAAQCCNRTGSRIQLASKLFAARSILQSKITKFLSDPTVLSQLSPDVVEQFEGSFETFKKAVPLLLAGIGSSAGSDDTQ